MRMQPPMSDSGEITQLLGDLLRDRPAALQQLMGMLQHDLRRIAHAERASHAGPDTLSTTVLVNEAFLRFRQGALPEFNDRKHFFHRRTGDTANPGRSCAGADGEQARAGPIGATAGRRLGNTG